MYNEGKKTFIAGEVLEERRNVRIKSGTITTPPEVVYADAGEDGIGVTEFPAAAGEPITVKLWSDSGTFEVEVAVSASIVRGATLYPANDGKLSDASSGSAAAVALEPGITGQQIEVYPQSKKSTTAALVSADAGGLNIPATVQAALAALFQNALSIQNFIPVSLMSLREASSMAVGAIAAACGVLGSDTTPILKPINGATDGCQNIEWVESNNDPVIFQVPLPPDLDDEADIVVHTRVKSAGTTDAVGFTVDSWFNEGDTKVVDTSETNQTATWAEKITTIAAADVPAGAQTLTVSLTPVAHTTDHMYLSAVWLEYKTKIKTS
jgi:hypothetical protein